MLSNDELKEILLELRQFEFRTKKQLPALEKKLRKDIQEYNPLKVDWDSIEFLATDEAYLSAKKALNLIEKL